MSELSDAVWKSYLSGNTNIKALSEEYGVCRERIRQLVALKERAFKKETRPLPVVRDEHGETARQTYKQLLQKINEELDELKAAVLREVTTRNCLDDLADGVDDDTDTDIAEEAADTITAITTLCEALGIDAEARNEAQRRVNEKNRKRGRL